MSKRNIIKIDESKCDGCKACIPNCPEGALQIIDGKARLISDLFCDGLGACIGHCPKGAITVEVRQAQPYDEKRVMDNVVRQGKNVIKAHLKHLKDHGADEYYKQAKEFLREKGIKVEEDSCDQAKDVLPCGCPGTNVVEFSGNDSCVAGGEYVSRLRQWPVQIKLVPPEAPFLKEADLLIAADCVPFAYAGFHEKLLKGKILLVGCPKFDDIASYQDKITSIFKANNIKSVTYARMEVPCCHGLVKVIQSAIVASGKDVPFKEAVISIKGERL